jgi:hypothetical protein
MTVPIPRETAGQSIVTPRCDRQGVEASEPSERARRPDMSDVITLEPEPTTWVRWEPCAAPDGTDVCRHCGWAADDHGLGTAA